MPLHIHTHNTPGMGVTSIIEASNSGADIVDAATDTMYGLTYQLSLGSISNAVRGTNLDTVFNTDVIRICALRIWKDFNIFWTFTFTILREESISTYFSNPSSLG